MSIFKNKNNESEALETNEAVENKNTVEADVEVKKDETTEQFFDRAIEQVIDQFTKVNMNIINNYQRNKIDREELEVEAVKYVKYNIMHGNGSKTTKEEQYKIAKAFIKYLVSYDILDELIEDDSISDIRVCSPNSIYVKRNGKREKTGLKFRGMDGYKRFIEHLCVINKEGISDIDAIKSFVDKNTSDKFRLRFNITSEVVNSVEYSYLQVRKIPKTKYGMDKLVELGMMSNEIKEYLIEKAKSEDGFIFCGRGGSGKTTLMNELIEYIPEGTAFDCIQSNDELFSIKEAEGTFHTTVAKKGESKLKYDLSALGENGLLTDLDLFIIGEIKGGEAAHLSYAAYTDHITWTSVHSISTRDAHLKIADYAKVGGDSVEETLRKIQSIKTVVHLRKFKIDGISEVTGFDEVKGRLTFRDIDLKTGKPKK